MFISERQIEAVVETLENNEDRLTDGYDHYCGYEDDDVKEVLREIAKEVIENLNKVIYNAT